MTAEEGTLGLLQPHPGAGTSPVAAQSLAAESPKARPSAITMTNECWR